MKYGYQRTMTAREMRRIGERERTKEERRKQAEAFWAMTPEQRAQHKELSERLAAMHRNGITIDDLRRAEREGQEDGYKQGIEDALKTCYASIAMVAGEVYSHDKQGCIEVLRAVDERIITALSTEDAMQEVLDTLGIEITFNSPFSSERIGEKEVE